MHAPVQPPVLPVQPGWFHRLGLVTDRPATEIADFFDRVLGARPLSGAMVAVHGYPMGNGHDRPDGPAEDPSDGGESGATAEVRWAGRTPLAVFVPAGDDSPVAGFIARYGPGLHSLAWTVDDLWMVESLLRRQGVRITGIDLPGRHLFMHPKDSAGLLVEWTDTAFVEEPRSPGRRVPATDGAVAVRGVAYVTSVVPDIAAATEVLQTLVATRPSDGPPLPALPGEQVADLVVGDLVVRLRAPRSPDSQAAALLASGGARLASLAFAVDDLATAERQLGAAGIRIVSRTQDVLVTDPADTLGWPVEWTDRQPVDGMS